MLVSCKRFFNARLVRRFNPVPSSIAVSSQPPRVFKCTLISSSSSKRHHHTSCRPRRAEGGRVIGSNRRKLWVTYLQREPWKRGFVNIQTPDIVDGFCARVAAKHKQIWLWEHNSVTIPSAWRLANNRHNHPLCCCITISQIEEIQIIRSQTATYKLIKKIKKLTSSRSSINNHLKRINGATAMCCSRWRLNSRAFS